MISVRLIVASDNGGSKGDVGLDRLVGSVHLLLIRALNTVVAVDFESWEGRDVEG